MPEPLERLLNSSTQVAVARLEDSVVKAIYEIDPSIAMHGGTAIWRCYGGYRYSSDVDLYLPDAQVKKFNFDLTWKIAKYNMRHDPPKRNGRFVRIFNDSAETKLESMKPPRGLKPVPALYEMANGTKISIMTLDIDSFVREKMATYLKRLYARDLFDVYQLVINHDVKPATKKEVLKILENLPEPKDEAILKDIVYVGPAPTFDSMVAAMRGRLE